MEVNKPPDLVKEGEDSVRMNFNSNSQGTVDGTGYGTWQP